MAEKKEREEEIFDPIASTYFAGDPQRATYEFDPQRATYELKEKEVKNVDKIEREATEARIATLDKRIAEIKVEIRKLEAERILEAKESFKVSLRLQFPEYSESQLETYVKGR